MILFDLYDTLITAPWSTLARRWSERLGIPADEVSRAFDATRKVRGRGQFDSAHAETAAIVEACGISPDSAVLADLVMIEDVFLASEVVPFSDTFPALNWLSARGVATGIVSNCSRPTGAVVDRFELRDVVDVVVLSFELGITKPEPEIYRHAMSSLGVENGLFVDDQIRYLDGAARIGLSTVQIIHPEARNSRPPISTHEVVTSLAQVTSRHASLES